MTTPLLITVAYLGLVTCVVALLKSAKHGDEANERASFEEEIRIVPGPSHPGRGRIRWMAPVDTIPEYDNLGDVAAHIRHMLGVERVSMAVVDDPASSSGVVAACVNAPGLLGARVPVGSVPCTGLLSDDEAAARGLVGETPGGASWAYADVPLHGADGVSGSVSVAARRVLAFTSGELRLIERLVRRGAPQFERRRQERAAA